MLPRCPFCGKVQPGFHVEADPPAAGAGSTGCQASDPRSGTGASGDSTLKGIQRSDHEVIPTQQQTQGTQQVEMSYRQQPLIHEHLLQYEQELIRKGGMLKQRYEQESHQLRSMELNSLGQQLGPDQQQQLMRQRTLCQQLLDELQALWKQQQELNVQLKSVTLRVERGPLPSQQQKVILQGRQWVPVQQEHNQQGILAQQQQQQAPGQQIWRAENNQWSGGDQQQEDERRRLLEQQRGQQEHGLLQQQIFQQQRMILHGRQWVPGGYDQKRSVEQQRVLQQQEQHEQLQYTSSLDAKLSLLDSQQQQLLHEQQKKIVEEQIWLEQQTILRQQQQGVDVERLQNISDRQQFDHSQQQLHKQQMVTEQRLLPQQIILQHQAEGDEQYQQGRYEQQQEILKQQHQLQHRSQQPTDGHHHLTGDEYMQKIRDQTLSWQMTSQEQDTLQQQQQRMQQHRQELEQQRKEQQHKEKTIQEMQGNLDVVCECGTPFHPGAKNCANSKCGKPRPRNQPQGPPCVHCGKLLMKEGASRCQSCYKKQPETPTNPPEGAGTGIPPPPGLAQPGGVQPHSTAKMIALPASLPHMSHLPMVFGEMATVPPYLLLSSVKGHQSTSSEIHPTEKRPPLAGDNPSAVVPNTQQQQGSSTQNPQGCPATGVSGDLPSNQGNDSGKNQPGLGQPPGVPASARPTKDQSATRQSNSVMLPNIQPCAADPLGVKNIPVQDQSSFSNEQEQTTQPDDNNNTKNTSVTNDKPTNHAARSDDKDKGNTPASGPPESQSIPKSKSGNGDPPLDDHESCNDPKKASGENNKGNQNSEKNSKSDAHSASANTMSYAAVASQKVFDFCPSF